MKASDIRNRKDFEAWLNARPMAVQRQEAVVLAHRAAMRAVPFVQVHGELNRQRISYLLKNVFRPLIISRVAAINLSYEFVRAARYDTDIISFATSVLGVIYKPDPNYLSSASEAVTYSASLSPSAFSWDAIVDDAQVIEVGATVSNLLKLPLWNNPPGWWLEQLDVFDSKTKNLESTNQDFETFRAWYLGCALGDPIFGIQKANSVYILERNIAMGSTNGKFNKKFWNRGPFQINADVKRWVEASKAADKSSVIPSVFVSYTEKDEDNARRVGKIVEDGGFGVFANYKVMAPGNDFVREMQMGLAKMGKFVPLYSPDYLVSQRCQAEFNAAYQMDPLGERRLIVGFLLKPTKLLPLQTGITHVPLYDLSEDRAKAEILAALRGDLFNKSPTEWRTVAQETASHIVVKQPSGAWDLRVSDHDRTPFIDDDIARLPEHVLNLAKTLRGAIPSSNAPTVFAVYLNNYISECESNGLNASNAILSDWSDLIAAQWAIGRDSSWAETYGDLFRKFIEAHRLYIQHYPAILRREVMSDQSTIDPAKFDSDEYITAARNLAAKAKIAHQDGAISDAFLRNVESDEAQRREISDIVGSHTPSKGEKFLTNTGEITPEILKKRHLFEKGGKWAKAAETMGSIGKGVAEKATASAIVEGLKKVADFIF